MNLNMSELEQAQEMSGTEEYLRNIWKTLNVGLNGYITSQELGQVCDHIGMEMNKTVSSWQLALSKELLLSRLLFELLSRFFCLYMYLGFILNNCCFFVLPRFILLF